MKIQSKKTVYLFYLIFTVMACALLIVTNFSYDAEYQLSMAYRIIKGDSMIAQMWEPNQTSAFLCAIIMKCYLTLTGSTTGIVLFTQFIGFCIRFGIGFYLYWTIRDYSGRLPGLVAGFLYLLISPKDLLIPEYSNMQLWFSTLMCLTLIHYWKKKQPWLLVLSAVSFCLAVLAYPSFLVAYIAMFFLLWHYSDTPVKDIALFTGICALIGGAFVGYLLLHVGWDTIITCLPKALAVEPTHTVSLSEKLLSHLLTVCKTMGILALVGVAGLILERMISGIKQLKTKEKTVFSVDRWLFLSWYLLLALLLVKIIRVENTGATWYPFLVLIGLGVSKRKLLSDTEKCVYYSALWIGLMNLCATMLLSDHDILRAVPYMLLAVCGSVLPLYHWFTDKLTKSNPKKLFTYGLHAFLLLILFRSLYLHVPISGRGQVCSILSDLALIRSGPAIGLITNEEGAAMQRDSMKEWKEYIKPGDTIWILGEPVDTLGYLYEDVEVGAPTVMSTPTYNEELLYYWELNPEKYPDVVILSSGFGELSWDLLKNDWLMTWLEEEYRAETIIDGNYWRYYFKE